MLLRSHHILVHRTEIKTKIAIGLCCPYCLEAHAAQNKYLLSKKCTCMNVVAIWQGYHIHYESVAPLHLRLLDSFSVTNRCLNHGGLACLSAHESCKRVATNRREGTNHHWEADSYQNSDRSDGGIHTGYNNQHEGWTSSFQFPCPMALAQAAAAPPRDFSRPVQEAPPMNSPPPLSLYESRRGSRLGSSRRRR